jgi:multicomponent Na+:H+ antiporter subunit A
MGTGAQSLTFLALLLPFIGALAAPALCRVLKHNAAWVLAVIPLWLFIHFAGFLDIVSTGGKLAGGYDWVPSLGVRFS